MNKIFDIDIIEVIPNKLIFHFINIENYNKSFKDYIDSKIVSIYNSTYDDEDIDLIKEKIKTWLIGKDKNKKSGYIAEFICHLYINSLDYEQHFIFENLEEEGSMKKGFDGLYKVGDEIWIYESKSSIFSTKTANHNANISEAYRDIRDKLSGKKQDSRGNPISPWDNAVNHVKVADVNDNKTLLQNLKEFRKRFNKKNYEDIKNFNVIPSSTLFLEERWKKIDSDNLQEKLEKLIKKYKYKKMNVLCINKKSINDFIEYINEKI